MLPLILYLLVFSSTESSSPAVGEEGTKIGIELLSSGEGDTLSDDEDVSLALGSPENCRLWNLLMLSIGVPCEGGVGRNPLPSTGVEVRCLDVRTCWYRDFSWTCSWDPLVLWTSVGVEWCCGGKMWEPSSDRSECTCSCSFSPSRGANMSSCEEHASDSCSSFSDITLNPPTLLWILSPSLLPALLELVSLVDWVRSIEWSGRCLRTSGEIGRLPPLDILLRSPW